MARPTLPRALIVDRHTPMQRGGEATAELFALATGQISDAVDEICRQASQIEGTIGITALASYIGDVNDKFNSYFEAHGESFSLARLADTIYPRRDIEPVLSRALALVDAEDEAQSGHLSLESTNPPAAKAVTAVRDKAKLLAETVLSDAGPTRVVLEQSVLVFDVALNDPEEEALSHLGDAESFILGAQAMAQQDAQATGNSGDIATSDLLAQLCKEAGNLAACFDCRGQFYRGPAPTKQIAAAVGRREEVAA